MANPNSYTFRRRIILQIVMVVVFLATCGLAVLVSRSRNYAPPVELAAPMDLGLFRVSLPQGWTVTRDWLPALPPTPNLIAKEPSDSQDPRPSRKIEVAQHFLGGVTSPQRYLRTVFSLKEEEDLVSTPITVGDTEGELFELRSNATGAETRLVASHLYAVAVVDTGLVLLVHLEAPGRYPDASDRQLIREIAGAIQRRPVSPE